MQVQRKSIFFEIYFWSEPLQNILLLLFLVLLVHIFINNEKCAWMNHLGYGICRPNGHQWNGQWLFYLYDRWIKLCCSWLATDRSCCLNTTRRFNSHDYGQINVISSPNLSAGCFGCVSCQCSEHAKKARSISRG